MAYVPNATNAAEPLASESVESAALEFRTLKASITARVDGLTATVSTNKSLGEAADAALDARVDQTEAQLAGIALGTDSTALAANLASTASGSGAELVGFLQGGTGAVSRTVEAKAQEVVSLEDFGAVGDGIANDGPAAVLACNYCYATGATLRMLPRVYKNARIEVHGTFSVEGNGATVMYLGIGQTIVGGSGTGTACVPTPWPTDPGYSPSFVPTTMYTLAVAPPLGATTLTLTSVTGITVGMHLFICGNPSSMSSDNNGPNFIPKDFEFVYVIGIAGNVVTLRAPLQSSYLTTKSGVFYAPGLAVNCHVSGLNINTTSDAYQQVVRSSIGCTVKDIVFSGANAIGASTFSDGLVYENLNVFGTGGGGFSTARGTVSTVFRNINMKNYNVTTAFFLEESAYKVTLDNFVAAGGFAGGSFDCSGSQRYRLLTITNSMFSPSIYGGLYSPFAMGTVTGIDVRCINTVFMGSCVTPLAAIYPGITGTAMVFQSSSASTDSLIFNNCKFISNNTGPVWPVAASGFTGTVQFDTACTYSGGVAQAATEITPRGAWINMAPGLLNGFTVPAGAVAKYRIQDRVLYMKGRVNTNGAAAGTNFFLFPVGARPLTEAKWMVANDTAAATSIVRVSSAGDFFYVNSSAAVAYLQLDQCSFPLDI